MREFYVWFLKDLRHLSETVVWRFQWFKFFIPLVISLFSDFISDSHTEFLHKSFIYIVSIKLPKFFHLIFMINEIFHMKWKYTYLCYCQKFHFCRFFSRLEDWTSNLFLSQTLEFSFFSSCHSWFLFQFVCNKYFLSLFLQFDLILLQFQLAILYIIKTITIEIFKKFKGILEFFSKIFTRSHIIIYDFHWIQKFIYIYVIL